MVGGKPPMADLMGGGGWITRVNALGGVEISVRSRKVRYKLERCKLNWVRDLHTTLKTY